MSDQTEVTDTGDRSGKPPLPPRNIAELLAKLEAAIRFEERAATSHDRQEAEEATWKVRMALRVALAELLQARQNAPLITENMVIAAATVMHEAYQPDEGDDSRVAWVDAMRQALQVALGHPLAPQCELP